MMALLYRVLNINNSLDYTENYDFGPIQKMTNMITFVYHSYTPSLKNGKIIQINNSPIFKLSASSYEYL